MTAETANTNRKPSHRLYNVTGDGKDASWTSIGAAWPNRHGTGFTIICSALPLSGRIVMQEITAKAEGQPERLD